MCDFMKNIRENKNVMLLITVAALGYFVDIYDLLVFNIVKYASLKDLGFSADEIKSYEVSIFNWQMIGMMLGGILWGVYGDKKGRLSVLFGSIFLYSSANIANAFVVNVEQYTLVRFIAGVGLAGELGAGITLISETMKKKQRGIGTTIVVTFGILGAVAAVLTGRLFSWQVTYIVGGVLGFLLLLLRIGTLESSIFKNIKDDDSVRKGNFLLLLKKRSYFVVYLRCILIGLPIWFVVGILVALSARFTKHLGVPEVSVADNLMFCYIGLSIGDLLAGLLSQILRSRKKVIYGFIVSSFMIILVYLFNPFFVSANYFKWISMILGIGVGYWGLFVTMASEQFGTNIRSTVTNTVPNFIRGSVAPISWLFIWLTGFIVETYAGFVLAVLCNGIAFVALLKLEETFGKDLDYTDT